MAVIYNNIPAVGAPIVDHVITGCENQILFRADSWGVLPTQVRVDSFSNSDPTQKVWTAFTASSNLDWCLPCVSVGQTLRFSIPAANADPATQELFVEILDQGCCCGSSTGECWEIPVKLTQCP